MTERQSATARVAAGFVACALLAACGSSGMVVLLPEQDGSATAVVVKQDNHEIVLDRAYAAAETTALGPRGFTSSQEEVRAHFGSALAAQPVRTAAFTLYFLEGKDELTEESKQVVEKILSEIARRPVPDVLVIGHTDRVGSDPFNDALGQQRAEAVRAALIRFGIPAADIQAVSRGKRAPVVPTADGVPEPRNRRVEIIVR